MRDSNGCDAFGTARARQPFHTPVVIHNMSILLRNSPLSLMLALKTTHDALDQNQQITKRRNLNRSAAGQP